LKITIITPTYNSEKTILKSVKSIILQNYKNYEHIIVDNLSKDKTLKLVKAEYEKVGLLDKLKIISEKDSGISDAFNKGIKAAAGDIIAILNSDDFYYNNSVFGNVAKAFAGSNALFVHGDVYFEDDVYGSNIRRPLLCSIRRSGPYNHPTMFFKKEVYEKYGLYDTSFKTSMDMELICRLTKEIENFKDKGFYLSGEPLVFMSSGGVSWTNEFNVVREEKKAVKMHGFWNIEAFIFYSLRGLRVRLKVILRKMNMNGFVRSWRKFKWK